MNSIIALLAATLMTYNMNTTEVVKTSYTQIYEQNIDLDEEDKIALLQVYMIVMEGKHLNVSGTMDMATRNALNNFAKQNGFYNEHLTLDDIINYIKTHPNYSNEKVF